MWDEINLDNWEDVPSISGRVATEEDIANGIAVFAIPSGSQAYNVKLPLCAVQIDSETNERVPCIAIQIEEADNGIFIGVRYLNGGNGVVTSEEIELYEQPNEDFNL